MYNVNLKRDFVISLPDLTTEKAKKYERLFLHAEKFEELYKKDLYSMDADQLAEYLKDVGGVAKRSFHTHLMMVKKYFEWCNTQSVDGVNMSAISDVVDKYDVVDKMRNLYVSSPTHLQIQLDKIFEKETEQTTGNIHRAMCWLAFSGVVDIDIDKILRSDIIISDRKIKYFGRELKLYEESVPAIKSVLHATYYNIKHPNYTTGVGRIDVSYLDKSSPLISFPKERSAQKEPNQRLIDALSKARKKDPTVPRYICERLWESGVFYRAQAYELAGIPQDFRHEARQLIERKRIAAGKDLDDRNSKTSFSYAIRSKRESLLSMYEQWKLAF